jgi:toxin ParE1/3/4
LELRITARGERDLDDLWDYIARDSIGEADRFVDRVLERCRLIAGNPDIGRPRDDLVEGVRSFPVGDHLVFYHVEGETLFVDRVVSGYRDLPALFGE